MNVISTEKIPIKLWLDDIEEGALRQARNLANLPFAFHHIAIMPDSHQGYGMPIGGVLATRNVIIPNAVGVDIGCGMCAVKTSLTEIETETVKRIMGEIRKQIPLGFNHHKEKQNEDLMPQGDNCLAALNGLRRGVVAQEYNSALRQIGTLGGGNHFIEIQKGSDGYIWVMVHSGSRNIGKQVADYYNKLAIKLNAANIPKAWELAVLPIHSDEGRAYFQEMQYCVAFGLANRKLMMSRIMDIFAFETHCHRWPINSEGLINIAHNYAGMEDHFGEKVMLHRKGATLATADTIGIIPGSQGTKSYIVKGKGNRESFNSCSHGAGRKMGRKQAMRELDLGAEIKRLDKQGIMHAIRGKKDLDEAAGAYKDIDIVMANQQDLVEVLVELTPLAVIKG